MPSASRDVLDSSDHLQPVDGSQPALANACRREHPRVAGPFDGRRVGALETPVQLSDLSRGGCFINSLYEQQPGIALVLKIDLPSEGWITVKAETLGWRNEFGFAVRFVEMREEAAVRLERALQQYGPLRRLKRATSSDRCAHDTEGRGNTSFSIDATIKT